MKNTCVLTTLVLLVIITVCSGYNEEDVTRIESVTTLLNSYRAAHGARKVEYDYYNQLELEYSAYEATEAVCKLGRGHHWGTEAQKASLYYQSGPCQTKYMEQNRYQEMSEIAALKRWYSECPKYTGEGSWKVAGHFTHMVWKSVKNYGIWAKTCDNFIPGTKYKCVVALKTDGRKNLSGAFKNNVEKRQCANVDRPWARILYSLAPKVSSPLSPYVYGLNPFINNQHLSSAFPRVAFPYLYNYQPFQVIPQIPGPVEVSTPVKVEPYAFKPTEAPVAPEGYIAPNNEGVEPRIDSAVTSGCLNYKGESVPCNEMNTRVWG